MAGQEHTSAAPLAGLPAIQRDILRVVRDIEAEAPVGTDVLAALEDELGEKVHYGRFHPNLAALEEEGLIERSEAEYGPGKPIALTDEGREQVAARARLWQEGSDD